jgi:hypothetical protein
MAVENKNISDLSAAASVLGTDLIEIQQAGVNKKASTSQLVLDEDDMVSDSAVKAPSQQSVKAYVDSSVGTAITADNGLTRDVDNIELGGTVDKPTDIVVTGDTSGDDMLALKSVSGDDNTGLFFQDDGLLGAIVTFFGLYNSVTGATHRLEIANGIQLSSLDGGGSSVVFNVNDTETVGIGVRMTDNRTTKRGIEYAAAGYVTGDRSLTDKGYVDNALSASASGPLGFENNTETTKTLDPVSTTYFYTGSGDGTWTMYPVASNDGIRIEIKNMTAFNLTVQRDGSDNLYDVATTTSVIIGPGECWQIMCNGTYHVIMKS